MVRLGGYRYDELRRAARRLMSARAAVGDPYCVGVGFARGFRQSSDEHDEERPLCAQFLVSGKPKRIRRTWRIRPTVEITMPARGRRRGRTWTLPTDVYFLPPFRLTGTDLDIDYAAGGGDRGSAGVAVSWTPPTGKRYGILTVEHLVKPAVRVRVRSQDDGRWVELGRHSLTPKPGFDAAILSVSGLDQLNEILSSDLSEPVGTISVRPTPLAGTNGVPFSRPGKMLDRSGREVDFDCDGYFPLFRPTLPNGSPASDTFADVFRGKGLPDTFRQGCSGSPWLINGNPAALQFGAESDDFSTGYAHSLASIRDAYSSKLGVPVRIVRCF